ncbi:MAG TPA: TAT-variant-translocated molybdopterin oxidoreductase [Thermoanaerobaculia bacterium]|nr:TAT-variant-translocated molybdopterin oxidoreductase [Thermoanaerobaculia bacterium]
MTTGRRHLDLAAFGARLSGENAPEYWRALEELAEDPSLHEVLREELARESAATGEGVDRRDFLRLMGASVAMGGLAACTPPAETIVPWVDAPEQLVPGRPLFYASAMELDGVGAGVLVESHMGRPTKIEGNPDHPGSLGATDHFAQASILSLYDPERSGTVRYTGDVSTWAAFVSALQATLQTLRGSGGEGLRVLTEGMSSPTAGSQMREILQRYPAAAWHTWQPVTRDSVLEGSRLAFGRPLQTVRHFGGADVVLALDSDFLAREPGFVRYTRDFMDRRRVRAGAATMNRLYVAESMPTPTGTMADHRVAIPAGEIETLARAIAGEIGVGTRVDAGARSAWAEAVARDLRAHPGRSIVLAGENQPPAVHAIVHAINAALGNAGRTVHYIEPVEANPVNQGESMRRLATDMRAGRVRALLILGGNPAFTAPADLEFARAMDFVPFRVHLGTYYDETSARSHWHVPATHFLEAWSDTRACDGTVSIVQPLIRPLYNGASVHEILAALNEDIRTGHEIVRDFWRERARTGADFDATWNRWLHDGVIPDSALPPVSAPASGAIPAAAPRGAAGIEVVLRPDPMIHDGRFANNSWLQELPKPVTKLTWDNAALMSPATASVLKVANGDVIEIEAGGRTVQAPVWSVPAHADDSITLDYGYGALRTGEVGRGTGTDVYPFRTLAGGDIVRGVTVRKTGRRVRLATVQMHHELAWELADGAGARRNIVRSGTLDRYRENPEFLRVPGLEIKGGPSLYPEWPYETYAWGMVIDTNVCTGCGICTIACQAENSIPVVGKEQVLVGREMHWIRTDHYYKGDPNDPDIGMYNVPIPCMHCENAPCEPVCPVEATSHSDEGINEMTYNRCVGTRYCANNCPYKVRRFNFLSYADFETESYKAMRNPDVTVRSRGVMEKCTYCIQRINEHRIEAEKDGRRIRDGEFTTACAQACPTRAIRFGDLNDSDSDVARLRAEPLNYGMLTELNTQPRTSYLGALKNPNPELARRAAPASSTEPAE